MSKKVYKYDDAPIYEIFIEEDDNSGIRLVSLVNDPAIEVQGMFFSKEEKSFEFKAIKEKQMIVGPGLIPDKKIIRKDEDGDPYYVFFSKDTIRMMMEKFNANNTGRTINVDHTSQMAPGFISENWIVEDPYYDKSRMYGFNLPVGSWFIQCKIEDKNFWENEVKEGGRYSFSVEGLMNQKPMNYSIESVIDSLNEDEVYEILSSLKKKISFDFDQTLDREDIQKIAREKVKDKSNEVYIVTRRSKKDSKDVYRVADKVGIKRDNIFFTEGEFKYRTIMLLDIDVHYDDKQVELDLIKAVIPCVCIKV